MEIVDYIYVFWLFVLLILMLVLMRWWMRFGKLCFVVRISGVVLLFILVLRFVVWLCSKILIIIKKILFRDGMKNIGNKEFFVLLVNSIELSSFIFKKNL